MEDIRRIIKEEDIILYGKNYTEVIYDTGEIELKRYNEKTKMWGILKFKPDDFDDTENLKRIREATRNALFNTLKPR